jgi:hypothetical protein
MTKRSEEYIKGIPTKPYDLLREGLIVLGLVVVIVLILAGIFSSPDYPAVRGEDVAKLQPVAYLKTCANILAGNASVQDYGPPYTTNYGNAQQLFGIAPADWWGVSTPIDPSVDFILKPLERTAVLNPQLTGSLTTYQSATPEQQNAWLSAYLIALDKTTVVNGKVNIPEGNYGPVGPMMDSMLALGQAGLLEGALESSARLPFTIDFTRSLLFFQDDVDSIIAETLDMTGEQWGVVHETGNYPGAFWLWPYAFWYQVPPMSTSPNADIEAIAIITVIFLILLFLPFIPVLNSLPRWTRVYRLIWRDWYSSKRQDNASKPDAHSGVGGE